VNGVLVSSALRTCSIKSGMSATVGTFERSSGESQWRVPSLDSLTFVVVENPEKIKSMILGDSSGSVIVIAPSKRRL